MKNLKNLEELSFHTSKLYASALPGEKFNPKYLKNPKLFRKIVKSDRQLEKSLTVYFKELSERIADFINWGGYDAQVRTAGVKDLIMANWTEEGLNLKVLLTDALVHALVAGGQMTEEDTGIDIGWNESEPAALDYLAKYTLKLSGNLNDTTVDRIKKSLQLSLSNGENQEEATARLAKVLDNPLRAATIAHTEAVRAFSYGRLSVADEIGADRKQWDSTIGACPICEPLDGLIVGIDEEFESEFDAPPAHPNCRCLIKILMPNE